MPLAALLGLRGKEPSPSTGRALSPLKSWALLSRWPACLAKGSNPGGAPLTSSKPRRASARLASHKARSADLLERRGWLSASEEAAARPRAAEEPGWEALSLGPREAQQRHLGRERAARAAPAKWPRATPLQGAFPGSSRAGCLKPATARSQARSRLLLRAGPRPLSAWRARAACPLPPAALWLAALKSAFHLCAQSAAAVSLS